MQLLQLQLQAADADGGCQVLSPFIRLHGGNLGPAVRDDRVHIRRAYDAPVIIDGQGFAPLFGPGGDLGELLRALRRHHHAHRELRAHAGLYGARAGLLYIRPLYYNGAVFQQLIDGLVQHIAVAVGTVPVLHSLLAVVAIALRVRLGNEVQCARLPQFLQNGVGIADAGNLDVDPVRALLVDNGLRAVVLHTFLKLRNGIAHVGGAGSFISHHLVGDADAARQVKPQIDIRYAAVPFRVHTEDIHVDNAHQNQQDAKQYHYRLVLFHILSSLSYL